MTVSSAPPPTSPSPPSGAPVIHIEDLHKSYGSGPRAVHALRGVDLSVAPGEVFGLLGQNGAGKTTLIKVLLDIARATAGRASLLGLPTSSVECRRQVGYLPEDHRFPEYLSAMRVLELYGGLSRLSRRQARARGGELLDLVGLPDTGKRKVRAFSKGMKQRLGIAQALIARPQVLFLDEPTDGVDPMGRRDIRRLIQRLKEAGTTIFLNSHLLSEVEQVCDRVAFVHQGRIIRQGTIGEITGSGGHFVIGTDRPLEPQQLAGTPFALARSIGDQRYEMTLTEVGDEDSSDPDAPLDQLVDRLRAQGIGLRHLERKRLSLEDVFVALLSDSATVPAEVEARR